MRADHREALEATVAETEDDDGLVACILAGSIAKGWERPDSDVDVVVVATDEEYERRYAEWDLQFYDVRETSHGEVPVDGKVVDVAFLEEVAERGSEPARAAFVDVEVRYTEDSEIPTLVDEVATYPTGEKTDRIETFYSQMQAYRWYVGEAEKRDNAYLAHHTASQLALFGGRLLLANDETLFPYHKWFPRVLAAVEDRPDETMDLFETLLAERTTDAADAFVTAIEDHREWETPEVGWPVRFLLDREWQWRDGQPALEEL
jgi:predicted nucleotidyltransferase